MLTLNRIKKMFGYTYNHRVEILFLVSFISTAFYCYTRGYQDGKNEGYLRSRADFLNDLIYKRVQIQKSVAESIKLSAAKNNSN